MIIIDNRMRRIEKDYLKNKGYSLIEIEKNNNLYEEISSHVDIHICKIKNKYICEENVYNKFKDMNLKVLKGNSKLKKKYPFDISFNICNIGEYVVHNFKYTDPVILQIIDELGLKKINVNQGYTNCNICVLNDNACITSDKGIYEILKDYFDVIYINLDIKLINKNKYSNMKGCIGGCLFRLNDEVILTGDTNVENKLKLNKFISKYNLRLKYFNNLDIIDYGGVLEIE